MQQSLAFSAGISTGRGINPSLGRAAFNAAPFQRNYQSSAAHGASATAAPEPTDAASTTATPEKLVLRPVAHGVPSAPWTPTDQLQKRKTLPKRMGFMLQELEKERVQEEGLAKNFPVFGPGDSLELKLSVPENRRRVAVVKGTCIARRNRGWRTTITIRNHIGNAGGIERTFPLYSPHIQEIKVLATKKVRRAKLYYLRDRQPKEYRI